MKLSTKGRYGLRAVIDIALSPPLPPARAGPPMRHEPQRRVDFGLPGLHFLRRRPPPGKYALFLGVEALVPVALNDKFRVRVHRDIPSFRRLHPVDFPATVFAYAHA